MGLPTQPIRAQRALFVKPIFSTYWSPLKSNSRETRRNRVQKTTNEIFLFGTISMSCIEIFLIMVVIRVTNFGLSTLLHVTYPFLSLKWFQINSCTCFSSVFSVSPLIFVMSMKGYTRIGAKINLEHFEFKNRFGRCMDVQKANT